MCSHYNKDKGYTNKNINEGILNKYKNLFYKISHKYSSYNNTYDFNDIFNECYILTISLIKNYRNIGKNSSEFGYVNKYLSLHLFNVLIEKQTIKNTRHYYYNKDIKTSNVMYVEELTESIDIETESLEYSSEELLKLINFNIKKGNINEKEKEKIMIYIESQKKKVNNVTKINKKILEILKKFEI